MRKPKRSKKKPDNLEVVDVNTPGVAVRTVLRLGDPKIEANRMTISIDIVGQAIVEKKKGRDPERG